MAEYYVVSSELLPEVVHKVIEARTLLQSGEVSGVSEAVKKVGISRGTFYKYKDIVYTFSESSFQTRKATISLVVQDQKGALSQVLSLIAQDNCNVLSISQTIPLDNLSVVVLTLDITDSDQGTDRLIENLASLQAVKKVELVAIE